MSPDAVDLREPVTARLRLAGLGAAPAGGPASATHGRVVAAPTPDTDGERPAWVHTSEAEPDPWDDPPWWRRIRWAPDRMAGVGLLLVVLVVGGVAVHRLSSAAPAETAAVPSLPLATPSGAAPAGDGAKDGAPVVSAAPVAGAGGSPVVSVVGLVGRSGLVTLAPGARVADALDAAGGVTPGGDRDGLNLARPVADGEQILVGVAPGPDGPRGPRSGIVSAGAAPGDPAPASAPAPAATPAPAGGEATGAQIDLNTADAAALDSLPGVGPATAAAILGWRAAHGRFGSVDQLAEVDGIGPATVAKLRPHVRV